MAKGAWDEAQPSPRSTGTSPRCRSFELSNLIGEKLGMVPILLGHLRTTTRQTSLELIGLLCSPNGHQDDRHLLDAARRLIFPDQ